ncbi:MAG: hypothetical protein AAF085_12100 [Planctomycetota bacterium]
MSKLGAIIMAFAVAMGFTPESQAQLDQWDGVDQRLGQELANAFDQFITEVESSVKANELSGQDVNVRTGNLRQAVKGEVDGPLKGFVGTTQGTTTPYAKPILGSGTTTIKPVNAKKLWVPVGKNLNPSGVARFTPRALYDTFGKNRISIFTSKKGNTVVFLKDPKTEDGRVARFKRNVFRGDGRVTRKGDLKGQIMFVLKDEVIIVGTDALAKGVLRMIPRGQQLLGDAIDSAITGPGGTA